MSLKSLSMVGIALALVIGINVSASGSEQIISPENSSPLRVYEVNRKVRDFPDKEDFSTPESSYAAIMRLMSSGDEAFWRRVNMGEVPDELALSDAKRAETKPEEAESLLNAMILEVRVFRETRSCVIAEITTPTGEKIVDERELGLEDGRWLNICNNACQTIDEARQVFIRNLWQEFKALRPRRPRIADPQAYLAPFVEFLRSFGEEPRTFVMKAIERHRLVIMGEIHNRPLYWAFNSSLVTHPDFPKYVGVIYLELPANDQGLVDEFLSAPKFNPTPVIHTLRDLFEAGWPSQPLLDFFKTVWMVNKGLPPIRQLRIVLVDMPRPWNQVQKREDWRKYRVDRDRYMAENILRDFHAHSADSRHALFIVGAGHAMLNMKYFDGTPIMSAGWHLRQSLGEDDVYAIFPHAPVQPNVGPPEGRVCLGLFDSAFAEIRCIPSAFPLSSGPFGDQWFDALPDTCTFDKYKDGYSAYLYLGPLEYETFAPAIAGFYTEEFIQEMDRRYRIMRGHGWAEEIGRKLTVDEVTAFINQEWGAPRWRGCLGPLNAWHYGDDWQEVVASEKVEHARGHPEVITEVAKQLFEALRTVGSRANPPRDPEELLPENVGYCVERWQDAWSAWVWKTFRENPVENVTLGKVFNGMKSFGNVKNLPTIEYSLTLKDGKVLKGELPFYYDALRQTWYGLEGLDWHLRELDAK